MSYRPHQQLIAPARDRSEPWRVVVGYVLVMAAELGLVYLLFAFVAGFVGEDEAMSAFRGIFVHAQTSRDTLLLLGSFIFMALATAVVTIQLHKRSPLGLVGPLPRAAKDFRTVARAVGGLLVVLWFVLPDEVELIPNLNTGRWLMLLPLALPALLVQTGAEELLFRGYLQQQIAARLSHPAAWMGIPALLFAWGHYLPEQMGANAVTIAAWAFCFSIAAADLTARTGALGAAVGLHFANNAVAILLTATPGPATGLALYLYPEGLEVPLTNAEAAVEFALIGVMWLMARLALRV